VFDAVVVALASALVVACPKHDSGEALANATREGGR
jgi:hypothetical protein